MIEPAAASPTDEVLTVAQERMREVFAQACSLYAPDVICDIGSFDGSDAVAFSLARPDSTVVAFEANPENFFNLCLSQGMLAQRVSFQHLAISDSDGMAEIVVPGPSDAATNPGHTMRGMGSLLRRPDIPDSRSYKIPKRTLDGFFGNYAQTRTFALWIDVEGHTKAVIQGAAGTLKRSSLVKLELETIPYWKDQAIDREMLRLMEKSGFKLLARSDPSVKQYDALFLNDKYDPAPLREVCRAVGLNSGA